MKPAALIFALALPFSLSAEKLDLETLNQSECAEVASALGIDYQKMIKGCLAPPSSPYASQSNFWSLLIWFRKNANQDGAAGESDYLIMTDIEDQLTVEKPQHLLHFVQDLSEKDLGLFPFLISKFIDLEKMTDEERAALTKKSPHLIKRLKLEKRGK